MQCSGWPLCASPQHPRSTHPLQIQTVDTSGAIPATAHLITRVDLATEPRRLAMRAGRWLTRVSRRLTVDNTALSAPVRRHRKVRGTRTAECSKNLVVKCRSQQPGGASDSMSRRMPISQNLPQGNWFPGQRVTNSSL
jgi:hypothetical protein